MSREIDVRDLTRSKDTVARKAELRSFEARDSNELSGGHRVRIKRYDAFTGNPSVVASEAAPAEKGNYVQRAMAHLRGIRRTLGLLPGQEPEFAADPHEQKASSGAVAVHLQQQYKGVPIFQAAETVRFAADGALKETTGTSVSVAREYNVAPLITVYEAVKIACAHVAVPDDGEQGATDMFGQPLKQSAVDVHGFEPKLISAVAGRPEQTAMFEAGPFGDKIKASLFWFTLGDDLRLCWEVIVTMPSFEGQYRVLVDSENEKILYCRQLMQSVAARGNVYQVDGAEARRMADFPRRLEDYGLPIPGDLPAGFVDDWVEQQSSVGNCVDAHLGESGPTLSGSVTGGSVTFDPSDAGGDDQKVLNIFYYNCFMHDYFYLLGFREADGNFQHDNFGRGGTQSDRVDARAHSGAVWGTANMYTPVDGLNPTMNMGLVESTGHHTAFDSSVVFHEFTHGVTNRLVGGRLNDRALEAPQSNGMGEGWSDYFPCTINNTTIVGPWVVGRPGGIRQYPYDGDFPDNFGDLGTGRYAGRDPNGDPWPHPIGEIWCATLLEMNRQIGAELGVQLVVDALKGTPANPSFLDARDAILSALDEKRTAGQLSTGEHAAARQGMWTTFSRFGMGPNASCNGAWLSGIVPDFEMPDDGGGTSIVREVTPNQSIPDADPAGITSTLNVAETGDIYRLLVTVDITHPYRGDLVVSLAAPDGHRTVLHNREGASGDNINTSYSSDEVEGLAQLVGAPVAGNWMLHVADFAGHDVGRLRYWKLEISRDGLSPVPIREEVSPALAIPDDDPAGVSSVIEVAESGSAKSVRIGVDITHTYISDLRVVVVAPSGQQAILHNREGGDQDNLIESYDSDSRPALSSLTGELVQGNWILRVTDLAGRDIGKLNRWTLEISM